MLMQGWVALQRWGAQRHLNKLGATPRQAEPMQLLARPAQLPQGSCTQDQAENKKLLGRLMSAGEQCRAAQKRNTML